MMAYQNSAGAHLPCTSIALLLSYHGRPLLAYAMECSSVAVPVAMQQIMSDFCLGCRTLDGPETK